MLGWLRERRRRRLREAPFPEEWEEHLRANVHHYAALSEEEQSALRGDTRVFIAEKYWEGCGGLELTDEIRVTIAAQACLLTLCLPHDYYSNVRSIFVYPASFRVRRQVRDAAGVVREVVTHQSGEAWDRGPVVLSWRDARKGGLRSADGQNVVFHEFAHKLDMLDGTADGYPPLPDDDSYRTWFDVMSVEYTALAAETMGRARVLDQYGAQNAVELFAVATEAFFEKPLLLRERHLTLYDILREFYRQDPAGREEGRRAVEEAGEAT